MCNSSYSTTQLIIKHLTRNQFLKVIFDPWTAVTCYWFVEADLNVVLYRSRFLLLLSVSHIVVVVCRGRRVGWGRRYVRWHHLGCQPLRRLQYLPPLLLTAHPHLLQVRLFQHSILLQANWLVQLNRYCNRSIFVVIW